MYADELESRIHEGLHRHQQLMAEFTAEYDGEPSVLVSAPGRVEILGNHTDHNNGRVVASAIDLDTLILAGESSDGMIHLVSDNWAEGFHVDMATGAQPDEPDTQKLMRGVAAGLIALGYDAPPYQAVVSSRVAVGSGLSSSAAFENALVGVHAALGGYEIPPIDAALVGKFAENRFMGKPSGLMDQLASSSGGMLAIDFVDPENPRRHSLSFDFEKHGYRLSIVNTGGDHADLTTMYAAIPDEMHSVAESLGGGTLSQYSRSDLLHRLTALRGEHGDRALLRAFHFFDEQERVSTFIDAITTERIELALRVMVESGLSSWKLLQNVYPEGDHRHQQAALGLYLTEAFLRQRGSIGAYRIHGGGFAGSILTVVPEAVYQEYHRVMDKAFGDGAVVALTIREHGILQASLP